MEGEHEVLELGEFGAVREEAAKVDVEASPVSGDLLFEVEASGGAHVAFEALAVVVEVVVLLAADLDGLAEDEVCFVGIPDGEVHRVVAEEFHTPIGSEEVLDPSIELGEALVLVGVESGCGLFLLGLQLGLFCSAFRSGEVSSGSGCVGRPSPDRNLRAPECCGLRTCSHIFGYRLGQGAFVSVHSYMQT